MLTPTFRILAFQNVLLVGRLVVFKSANQQNNYTVETSNFAVDVFLM
jgi:hypothetical protein